jgi:predicted CopG family antitoxin
MGMGSKNISISEEAYHRLRRARRHAKESFSQVIRRGRWDEERPTAAAWLEAFPDVPEISEAQMEVLEAHQVADRPPGDKW